MKKVILIFLFLSFNQLSFAKDNEYNVADLFFIDQMNSHNDDFALYFKTRDKAILARGENNNYINDYPKDLFIYDYKTKNSSPLISYEWFPARAKYFLEEYDFPVFPDDFAYYLLKDNKTLVMISAVKSLNTNFKFDIVKKKLELYPKNGKFDFIISSIAKNCGYDNFKENYKCSFYKPLISSTLIN
ncbi:hypothetical protein [Candidatus Pelagibacter ubique]|uniref:hypothetical protein n=1 Tax=Pelagibacter ubique TaxID=198252 RepID=UPI0003C7FC20